MCYLITSHTSWLVQLGIVSATVNAAIFVKIHQVNKQLITSVTCEAGWMPQRVAAHASGKDGYLPSAYHIFTLKQTSSMMYQIDGYTLCVMCIMQFMARL